jgi:hypothetical protein
MEDRLGTLALSIQSRGMCAGPARICVFGLLLLIAPTLLSSPHWHASAQSRQDIAPPTTDSSSTLLESLSQGNWTSAKFAAASA